MSIVIQCAGCGKQYKLRDDLAGKRVKCKCGQAMVVPAAPAAPESNAPGPAPKPESDDYGLAPVGGAGPSSLLDEDLPPVAEGSALPPAGALPPAKKPKPVEEPVRRTPKKAPGGGLVKRLGPVALMLGLMAVPVVVILGFIWLVTRPGFGSPEEAFAAHQEALLTKDWDGLIAAYTPKSREMFVDRMLESIAFSWEFEEDPSRDVEAVLEEYGLEEILPEQAPEDDTKEAAADSPETSEEEEEEFDYEEYARKAEEAAKEKKELRKRLIDTVDDKVALYSDLNDAIEAKVEKNLPENPVLAIMAKKEVQEWRRFLARVDLDDLEVDGETAEGSMTFKPIGEDKEQTFAVKFKKLGGRWYLDTEGIDHYDERSFRCLFGGGWL